MERLSGTYVERKEVISELYQDTKVGLDEREARHVATFKITYPTVFGYIKEGSSSSKHHFPAVKSFKDWNSFDCESGVKAFILNGMEDLKLQLYQDITPISSWMRSFMMPKCWHMICTTSLRSLWLKCATGWMYFIKNF